MTVADIDKHFGLSWDFELGMFDSEEVKGNK